MFKKEIKFNDVVKINLRVENTKEDFFKWTIIHEVWKNDILSAIITVDGV